jgi:hypothetical protein
MIIDLDENYRIRGDESCWQLEKQRGANGEVNWKPVKYFITLGMAVREAAQRDLRTFPAHVVWLRH